MCHCRQLKAGDKVKGYCQELCAKRFAGSGQNEISRQWRHRLKQPPDASCSYIGKGHLVHLMTTTGIIPENSVLITTITENRTLIKTKTIIA